MSTANEIVKEQMIQTTSKKIVRSPEKRKPRAYRTHSSIRIEGLCGLGLALNGFGALKAACTFSGSPKGDAH